MLPFLNFSCKMNGILHLLDGYCRNMLLKQAKVWSLFLFVGIKKSLLWSLTQMLLSTVCLISWFFVSQMDAIYEFHRVPDLWNCLFCFVQTCPVSKVSSFVQTQLICCFKTSAFTIWMPQAMRSESFSYHICSFLAFACLFVKYEIQWRWSL